MGKPPVGVQTGSMSSSWILDIAFHDAKITEKYRDRYKSFWLVINADGLVSQFSTPLVYSADHPVWDYSARLMLQLQDLSRAYLYVSLCTYDQRTNAPVVVAMSRVSLKTFPYGSLKPFSFPLISSTDPHSTVAKLSVSSNFTIFNPPQWQTPGYNPYQGYGGYQNYRGV